MANRDIRKEEKKKKKTPEKIIESAVTRPSMVQPEVVKKPHKEKGKP